MSWAFFIQLLISAVQFNCCNLKLFVRALFELSLGCQYRSK